MANRGCSVFVTRVFLLIFVEEEEYEIEEEFADGDEVDLEEDDEEGVGWAE